MRQRGENSLRAGASVPELAGRRGKSLGWPQTKAGEGEGAFFGVIDPFFVLVSSIDEPVGGIRHSHRGVFDAWYFLWAFPRRFHLSVYVTCLSSRGAPSSLRALCGFVLVLNFLLCYFQTPSPCPGLVLGPVLVPACPFGHLARLAIFC